MWKLLYYTWLWLPKKHIFVTVVVTWDIFFAVYSCSKGKPFRERTSALHRQQHEKDYQNVDVGPSGKISAEAHVNN